MNTPRTKTTAELVADLKAQSAGLLERLRVARQHDRFLLGSQTETRLRKSLASAGRLDLATTTLLTPAVHEAHAAKLTDRYLERWERIKTKQHEDWKKIPAALRRGTPPPSDAAIANNHLRFFTLIDSVTVVGAEAALHAAVRLKADLVHAVNAVTGIHCLGAVEVEVISLPIMRTIRDKDTGAPSEKRKLDVCDVLAEDLDDTLYRDETHLMLVHFHGVVTAKNPGQFDSFRAKLLSYARWSKAPRQIEIKKLSEEFEGKPKTVAKNLQHIATYITKGGNDWHSNAHALRYKIGFSHAEDAMDEITYTQINWRRDDLLRAEHKLDGIDDAMSLTVSEIAELALFIHKLMQTNRTGTGYLVTAGS